MPRPRPARQPRRLTESVIRPIRVDVPDVEDEEEDVPVAVAAPAPAASTPHRELLAINVTIPELLNDLSRHPSIYLHANEVPVFTQPRGNWFSIHSLY